EPRYRQLYDLRKALKGEHYEYRINGADELLIRDSMALFAGCVTSFQTHYQIDADDVVDSYNWAQLLAAPLLACATYSPLFQIWNRAIDNFTICARRSRASITSTASMAPTSC